MSKEKDAFPIEISHQILSESKAQKKKKKWGLLKLYSKPFKRHITVRLGE